MKTDIDTYIKKYIHIETTT